MGYSQKRGEPMELLDKVTIQNMLFRRKLCKRCWGRGYTLEIAPSLDATKFRLARPCGCVFQIVRLKGENEKETGAG